TGVNKAKIGDINISKTVAPVLRLIALKFMGTRNNSVHIETNIPDDVKIIGSTIGFHQIFLNLFFNAIDAMPKGGTLTVSAKQDGANCVISIKDTGEGIPEDIQKKIFDPFFTTKGSKTGKGTGIGLHVVSTEVKKHKGQIHVYSTPGNGAEFIITVP